MISDNIKPNKKDFWLDIDSFIDMDKLKKHAAKYEEEERRMRTIVLTPKTTQKKVVAQLNLF